MGICMSYSDFELCYSAFHDAYRDLCLLRSIYHTMAPSYRPRRVTLAQRCSLSEYVFNRLYSAQIVADPEALE